jgi:hypothetical protein
MAVRVRKNRQFLEYLAKCSPSQRKPIIKSATTEEVNTVCECLLNVYNKNIPLSKNSIAKLRPYKKVIKSLLSKKPKSLKQKKTLLTQRGGAILPLILSAVLPQILGAIFSKND